MNSSESEHVTGTPFTSDKRVRKVKSGSSSMIKTLKRKVSMGARTVRGGGCMTHRDFKQVYVEEEKLKNIKCSLSTTTGPIAGRLIISTEELAFCSDKDIRFSTTSGGAFIFARYKVMIPLVKVESVTKSENLDKHTDKYMQVVTVDRCEFWFMRIANYHSTIKYVQLALPKRIGSADTSSSYSTLGNLEDN